MRFKLVIFDFDGTLANSVPWFMATLNDVADRYGFRRVTAEELQRLRGRSNREVIQLLGVPTWKMPQIAIEMRERVGRELHRIPLFPGILDLFAAFPPDLRIAIVSSNAESNIRTLLGDTAARRVNFYECGASIFGKASRFRKVMARSAVPPDQTLCVGDETRDIEAARAARTASAAVTWGYATAEILRQYGPTYVVEDISELRRLICGEVAAETSRLITASLPSR